MSQERLKSTRRQVQAVLFDLDGTLVDSAPDLAGAVNDMRTSRGLQALPAGQLRPLVGSGARGMIGAAFGVVPGDVEYTALRDEFLDRYAKRLLQETVLFPSITPVLARLAAAGLPWGIVTNKAIRFAQPLVAALLATDAALVVVGGDSTPFTKPHPAPLLEAARLMNVLPSRCVYVGDDQRDAVAGRAAGMATLAAAWGYLGAAEPIEAWGADAVLAEPNSLLQWLELA